MDNNALGDFLRARRARLTCEDVGLPRLPGRRRVSGLRREEVAQLAAISTDYYTRLEQGRMQASPTVVAALARALKLDQGATAYLHAVAQVPEPHTPVPEGWPSTEELRNVQAFVDDLATTPAFVIGPRTEIYAWNTLAARLITDFGTLPTAQRYYLRLLVTDPTMRRLYEDWEGVTKLALDQLRSHNAHTPDDAALQHLLHEVCALDPDVERWWKTHDAAQRTSGVKVLNHPLAGELHLEWTALTWNGGPSCQVIAWQSHRDAPTRKRLELLATPPIS